ncbi:exopolysaccharide biosynthesis protein [Shewanella eurypsychrophilus]|uniref:Exopolysaccharide biosynthesis protein n=1 Tax=Shewanella eurypsychrophilus TaxID=2593656 RepID=A0ABX6V7Z6_9GAMM|nr:MULTISPECIES: exopolysaccharide biosynthesis protein [Shewanella]QFU23412.1 exopolysaccharide biosynthesis protein [Shewanella sp. YLB-09]QPG58641.1 exopolysaccharide biosynthesis protein [Shewanella eurypsychrophilus]
MKKHHPSQLLWLKRAAVKGSSLPINARRWVYVKTAFAALALIWTLVSLTLVFSTTRYESKWTLILPGAGAGAMVNLDSIGQASSSNTSPYASSAIDPRENYKALSISSVLMNAAAKTVNISSQAMGKPKLKLPNQTGLMQFTISSSTAQEAQDKAWAHYYSLQALLSRLREDETQQRENGVKEGLDSFAKKVSLSQQKILNFQSKIGLVSLDQFKELALTIERLRHSKVIMVSKLQGLIASQKMLELHLSLNPRQAADLLKLKNDQLYQQLLIIYTEATTTLAEYSGRYGRKHPQVMTQRHQQSALYQALRKRCKILLGYQNDDLMLKLSADDIDGRAQLMKQLLSVTTEAEGLSHEINALTVQIDAWDIRLESSNDDAAKLEDLHREHQLATAVFTSALAKMDVGKADIYSAYPLIQLLAPPSLPQTPKKLATILALLGGIIASIFSLAGLSILWIRKPILQKILMT